MNESLTVLATKHINDILHLSLKHTSDQKALVIYDTRYGLTNILTQGYRKALPGACFIDFDTVNKDDIIDAFRAMKPHDLVILIQSSNFLLDAFRIRLFLFQQKLKVIEHMHLYRNTEDVWDVYINSLAYDATWYGHIGHALKHILEHTEELVIETNGTRLVVTGGLEIPKLNIGDYAGMEHIGGTFPIGEVFTESKNFIHMNGSFKVYALAGANFSINMYTPFRVDVKEGHVTSWEDGAPPSFVESVRMIKEYERPLIREIGFGLNRAISRERYVQDITAFERILGMHLSMGEKHSVYKKPDIQTHKAKFHIDLFPVVDRVYADGKIIFEEGTYHV